MIVLGLTGSIGMGKSTVAHMFAQENVPVFDADAIVHELQGPKGALTGAIEARFPGMTGRDGVDRTALAQQVFADPEALRWLEGLIHPAVAAAREAFLQKHKDAPLVLLDIPLLFEAGVWEMVDKIVVVSAPAEIQRERVLKRPGMTEEKLASIFTRQMPDKEKCARADFIIHTDGSLEDTRASVRRIIACLTAKADS